MLPVVSRRIKFLQVSLRRKLKKKKKKEGHQMRRQTQIRGCALWKATVGHPFHDTCQSPDTALSAHRHLWEVLGHALHTNSWSKAPLCLHLSTKQAPADWCCLWSQKAFARSASASKKAHSLWASCLVLCTKLLKSARGKKIKKVRTSSNLV